MFAVLAVAVVVFLSGAAVSAVSSPPQPFATGFLGPTTPLSFQRAAAAGATIERLIVSWADVAPAAVPASWDPTNPDDSHYRWSGIDAEVAAAAANGQSPILDLYNAPAWADTAPAAGLDATVPDPSQFAAFAAAAAKRYSGADGQPRVSDWEIWNEPNLGLFFQPQFLNGQPYSPTWYRTLVNAAAVAIKAVHADNVVVAGSTAPFYDTTASTVAADPHWGPLAFMRDVLCLTPQLTAKAGCGPVEFDAWSIHPYSEGGPSHKATLADDVELGDLDKVRAVLDAAWSAGNISAAARPALWATEFSWNTDPPDTGGVPVALLERWIPEAMYQMWSHGVTVLTWFQLVDSAPPYQTGFYSDATALANDEPRPTLQAFTFPFVAYRSGDGIFYWGRTPAGRQATVAVDQADGTGGWTVLGQLTADSAGIFQGRFATTSMEPVRARTVDLGELSLPFSLRRVPDRFFKSFGRFQFEPSPTYPGRPTIPARWKP